MEMNEYKNLVVGNDFLVPILNGENVRYTSLDNAASTPPFLCVLNKVNEFAYLYSSVHRGIGFKSILASDLYDEAHEIVGSFVGADLTENAVIFVQNSTEAINMIANSFDVKQGDIIISSQMEHHSNDLPWRRRAVVKYVNITETGEIDMNHLIYLLNEYKEKVKIVTIN